MNVFNLKDKLAGLVVVQALLFALIGMLASTQLYADPPRVLNTTFEQYAKQQQQHDKQLMDKQLVDNKPAQSANSVKTPTDINATNTSSSASKTSPVKTSPSKASSTKKNNAPININQASEIDLAAALLGVGPAKAKAIVEYRKQNGAFKQVEDLMLVKGIGNATLEKNRDRLRLN